MKKILFIVTILFISVFSTACINNLAVQELNNKADEFMKKGDYENAISRLESSVDLDGTIFETQYNLAIAYTENGDYEDAIKTFDKALALNDKSKDLYYAMGVMYENYANDLYTGNLKAQKESASENIDDNVTDNKITSDGSYKATQEELENVKKYYNFSKEAYIKYLEIDATANDASEVEIKIKELDSKLETLDVEATN